MAQALSKPRFRTDLVAEPIDDGGQKYIDVTDPDSGATFRFYEVEYAIACAMDGTRNLTELVDWANEELGLRPPPGELETVIGTLHDLGYLEATNGVSTTASAAAAMASSPSFTELVPGVVVPRHDEPLPKADFQLGAPGARVTAIGEALDPPTATHSQDDFELGSPGAGAAPPPAAGNKNWDDLILAPPSPPPRPSHSHGDPNAVMEFEALTPPPEEQPIGKPSLRPSTRADSDDDGPTNLPAAMTDFDDDDVSVDLSAHLGNIRAEDVKEAVRASKVMQAVEVPADLMAQLEAAEGRATGNLSDDVPAIPRITPAAAGAAAAAAVPPAIAPPIAPVSALGDASARPIELPNKPVSVRKPITRPPNEGEARGATAQEPVKKAEPEKKRGVSPILIVLLVIALLGGAAAYYYFNYMQDDAGSTTPPAQRGSGKVGTGSQGAPKDPNAGKPTPPPVPQVVTAKLVGLPATSAPIKARNELKVVEIAQEGVEVAQDSIVVMFGNYKRLVNELEENKSDQVRYQGEIDKNIRVEKRKKDLAERQKREAELITEIDSLVLKAPISGTVKSPVKLNTTVKVDDIVALIEGKPSVGATFTVPKGRKPYSVEQNVELTAKTAADVKATCKVTAVEGDKVTVACPADSGLAVDTLVILP